MKKTRLTALVMALAMAVNIFPSMLVTAYAYTSPAYTAYHNAVVITMNRGHWVEDAVYESKQKFSHGKYTGSAIPSLKVTRKSRISVNNYKEEDLSALTADYSANSESKGVNGKTYSSEMKEKFENGRVTGKYDNMDINVAGNPANYLIMQFDEDDITDEKIKDNKITFSIPGNTFLSKTHAKAMAAGETFDGLKYSTVKATVTTNKISGTLKKIAFRYTLTVTDDSYKAKYDVKLTYNYSTSQSDTASLVSGTTDNGIVVYSSSPDNCVSVRNNIVLGIGVYMNEKKESPSKITYTLSDRNVLKVSYMQTEDKILFLTFTGMKQGMTTIKLKDRSRGYSCNVLITVGPANSPTYNLDKVPTVNVKGEKFKPNFYNYNGLFIDEYDYKRNSDGTANVSFDVYNTNYSYGAVLIYDENNELVDFVPVKKMSDNNTSIKGVLFDNMVSLAKDIWKGNLLSYRQQAGSSAKTEVKTVIPKNGHIQITLDSSYSRILIFLNEADIMLQTVSFAKGLDSSKSDAVADSLADDGFRKQLMESVKSEDEKLLYNSLSILKDSSKDVITSGESLGSFEQSLLNDLRECGKLKFVGKILMNAGLSLTENVFTDMSGFIGTTLNGLESFGKAENLFLAVNSFRSHVNSGTITIKNPYTADFRSDNAPLSAFQAYDFEYDKPLIVGNVSFTYDIISDNKVKIYYSINGGKKKRLASGKYLADCLLTDGDTVFCAAGRRKFEGMAGSNTYDIYKCKITKSGVKSRKKIFTTKTPGGFYFVAYNDDKIYHRNGYNLGALYSYDMNKKKDRLLVDYIVDAKQYGNNIICLPLCRTGDGFPGGMITSYHVDTDQSTTICDKLISSHIDSANGKIYYAVYGKSLDGYDDYEAYIGRYTCDIYVSNLDGTDRTQLRDDFIIDGSKNLIYDMTDTYFIADPSETRIYYW